MRPWKAALYGALKTATKQLKQAIGVAERSLAPDSCLVCHGLVGQPARVACKALCDSCFHIHQLALLDSPACCIRCALPLIQKRSNQQDPELKDSIVLFCPECLQKPPAFQRSRAATCYETIPKLMVRKLKVEKKILAAEFIAEIMSKQLLNREDLAVDAIIAVPLHKRRQHSRGFNQSLEIGLRLSRKLSIDLLDTAVTRVVDTPSQQNLSKRERQTNLRRAFSVKPETVVGRRVAIVDDVVTSTATVRALALTLQEAGTLYCEVWCYSRTPDQTQVSSK